MNSISFKGTRWLKCDLHLHTPASQCFTDQTVTPEQWVNRALEVGLNCVAITDHNTGGWIDQIKQAAEGKDLVVFPGTELTCSDSKIHLLILFDTDKSQSNVEDFLIRAKIRRSEFGDQKAKTNENLETIVKLADEEGGLVIPAHIDEYNGLSFAGAQIRQDFLEMPQIHAVQVVHKQFLNRKLRIKKNEALEEYLNEYYETLKTQAPRITENLYSSWFAVVQESIDRHKAILTFSDNPHSMGDARHGLWGIGSRFTWIKMDEKPNLESLRQALLLPKFRIRNDFDCPESPYRRPQLWIKQLSVKNTEIASPPSQNDPLWVDFSPQMTTVIGGRGSGKSSILRFIRGAMNRVDDLSNLKYIKEDQERFFKLKDKKDRQGVLSKDSSIIIEFCRNNQYHRITTTGFKKGSFIQPIVERWNAEKQSFETVEEEGFIDFFEFEIFSQKQIYAIAQEPNALRERIDSAIPKVRQLKVRLEALRYKFFEQSAKIRTIQQRISGKGRVMTTIKDLENQLNRHKELNMQELLAERKQLMNEEAYLKSQLETLQKKTALLSPFIQSVEGFAFDVDKIAAARRASILEVWQPAKTALDQVATAIQELMAQIDVLHQQLAENISQSQWYQDFQVNKTQTDRILGESDVQHFERLIKEVNEQKSLLATIIAEEQQLKKEIERKTFLKQEYFSRRREINFARKDFLAKILSKKKVRMSPKQFRDRDDYQQRFRGIIQKETGYEADMEKLTNKVFAGHVERNLEKVFDELQKIRSGEDLTGYSGRFRSLLRKLTVEQLDQIELLLPEDKIDVSYKPNMASNFKPLSNASAGQKTSAILTFILSHGNTPLILDQPEDDLDNHLVYDLIVESLRKAKERRQIIIVTHNANIPVNGDSELVVAMDSQSKYLEVLCCGSIEQERIKEEICDVMEGGVKAFKRRSRRYDL